MSEIRNARIERVSLGIEDHGILTAFLHLDYGGSAQGFGGYSLEGEYASKFIRRVLEVLDARDWHGLTGKIIRADTDFGKAHGIGHALRDDWFYPSKEWADQP